MVQFSRQETSIKYEPSSLDASNLKGLLALLNDGISISRHMLKNGYDHFTTNLVLPGESPPSTQVENPAPSGESSPSTQAENQAPSGESSSSTQSENQAPSGESPPSTHVENPAREGVPTSTNQKRDNRKEAVVSTNQRRQAKHEESCRDECEMIEEPAFQTANHAHCGVDVMSDTDDSNDGETSDEVVLHLTTPRYRAPKRIMSVPLDALNAASPGCVILYHERFSQGKIDGRNGSNACSFIAVIMAKIYLTKTFGFCTNHAFRSTDYDLESMILVAMQQGNRLYDTFRRSLPHRYCSVAEVSDQFASVCPFTVQEERPVSIKNDHYLSTLKGQLELLMSFKKVFVAIFTCNEKTSLFCCDKDYIAFIDTHTHTFFGRYGGAVYIVAGKDLDSFVAWIASMNGILDRTFGNLTFIKFH